MEKEFIRGFVTYLRWCLPNAFYALPEGSVRPEALEEFLFVLLNENTNAHFNIDAVRSAIQRDYPYDETQGAKLSHKKRKTKAKCDAFLGLANQLNGFKSSCWKTLKLYQNLFAARPDEQPRPSFNAELFQLIMSLTKAEETLWDPNSAESRECLCRLYSSMVQLGHCGFTDVHVKTCFDIIEAKSGPSCLEIEENFKALTDVFMQAHDSIKNFRMHAYLLTQVYDAFVRISQLENFNSAMLKEFFYLGLFFKKKSGYDLLYDPFYTRLHLANYLLPAVVLFLVFLQSKNNSEPESQTLALYRKNVQQELAGFSVTLNAIDINALLVRFSSEGRNRFRTAIYSTQFAVYSGEDYAAMNQEFDRLFSLDFMSKPGFFKTLERLGFYGSTRKFCSSFYIRQFSSVRQIGDWFGPVTVAGVLDATSYPHESSPYSLGKLDIDFLVSLAAQSDDISPEAFASVICLLMKYHAETGQALCFTDGHPIAINASDLLKEFIKLASSAEITEGVLMDWVERLRLNYNGKRHAVLTDLLPDCYRELGGKEWADPMIMKKWRELVTDQTKLLTAEQRELVIKGYLACGDQNEYFLAISSVFETLATLSKHEDGPPIAIKDVLNVFFELCLKDSAWMKISGLINAWSVVFFREDKSRPNPLDDLLEDPSFSSWICQVVSDRYNQPLSLHQLLSVTNLLPGRESKGYTKFIQRCIVCNSTYCDCAYAVKGQSKMAKPLPSAFAPAVLQAIFSKGYSEQQVDDAFEAFVLFFFSEVIENQEIPELLKKIMAYQSPVPVALAYVKLREKLVITKASFLFLFSRFEIFGRVDATIIIRFAYQLITHLSQVAPETAYPWLFFDSAPENKDTASPLINALSGTKPDGRELGSLKKFLNSKKRFLYGLGPYGEVYISENKGHYYYLKNTDLPPLNFTS